MIWTKDKILSDLLVLGKKLGHSPSSREVRPTLYQASRRQFGSFNKAKEIIGLEIFLQKRHYLKNDANVLNNDLAYIFGAVKGDGHYRKRVSSRRTSAEIILKVVDIDFAEEFRSALKKWSGIEPKFKYYKGRFCVALYSVDAVDIIQRLSFSDILGSNKKIKVGFLRGLFDSEGGVTGHSLDRRVRAARWIHFSNSEKDLIDAVSKLLREFKIDHKIRSRIHSGFRSTRLQYELFIYGLENLERFYKYIGFSIKRKNNKLLKVINSYEKYQKKTSQGACL